MGLNFYTTKATKQAAEARAMRERLSPVNEFLLVDWPRAKLHIRPLRSNPTASRLLVGVFRPDNTTEDDGKGLSVVLERNDAIDLKNWLGRWIEVGWR
jgi:hypothetical protein